MFSEITLHRGIDLTNLPCLTSVLPGDTSDSGNSSSSRYYVPENANRLSGQMSLISSVLIILGITTCSYMRAVQI